MKVLFHLFEPHFVDEEKAGWYFDGIKELKEF